MDTATDEVVTKSIPDDVFGGLAAQVAESGGAIDDADVNLGAKDRFKKAGVV
jgi:hypothetical protein